jgi:hypothetical protein
MADHTEAGDCRVGRLMPYIAYVALVVLIGVIVAVVARCAGIEP